jgi:hypothetical protein
MVLAYLVGILCSHTSMLTFNMICCCHVLTGLHCVFYSPSNVIFLEFLVSPRTTYVHGWSPKPFCAGIVNSEGRKKALVVLQHSTVLAVREDMALLVKVFDDQKGLGSILAISFDVLAENKVAPAAAMQTVRYIPSSLSPSRIHRSCVTLPEVFKKSIFYCFMIGCWDFTYLVLISLSWTFLNIC